LYILYIEEEEDNTVYIREEDITVYIGEEDITVYLGQEDGGIEVRKKTAGTGDDRILGRSTAE
jgi:hypothetical protein